jgi:glycogen debranching enzyme
MAGSLEAQPPVPSGAGLDPRHPGQLLLHEGYTYLLTAMDGSIGSVPEEGLFDHDLRLLSWHRISVCGQTPTGPGSSPIAGERWLGILGVRPGDGSVDGPRLPQDVLEVRIERRVGCGLLERLEVTNHSMAPRHADLEIVLGTGFRDVTELRHERPLTGTAHWAWDESTRTLTVHWEATHRDRSFVRGIRVRVAAAPGPPRFSGPDTADDHDPRFVLRFDRRLRPHGSLAVTLVYESLVDGAWRSPAEGARVHATLRRRDAERASIRSSRPLVETPESPVGAIVERALEDLLALRNWDIEGPHPGWIVNAGASKYLGFFARDALISGRQGIAFGPAPLRGALERAALTQGRADVPERDEEPGRIVHEMRRGPLAELGIRPFGRYYGSLTGAGAFVVGLADYLAWTGDIDTTLRLLPHAREALAWAARASQGHPAGLLASGKRARHGLRNQGWKDSEEAMRGPDGRVVPTPYAPATEQAWWYRALGRAAGLFEAADDPDGATGCRAEQARIRRVVEDGYWMPDAGTYATALDRAGERVESIGSDPLHLLAAGLPAADRARAVADRLGADDLWTGWGVRTLSATHPAYNPFAYHLGSVWPVETAAFAEGCRRYRLLPELEALATATFSLAAHFHQLRMPEVVAGHGRDVAGVPAVYPTAQTPQAWSAGAVLSVMTSLLGLDAHAREGRLIVDTPRLPAWLPLVRIRRLPMGHSTVDLEFHRASDGTVAWSVFDATGPIEVVAGNGGDGGRGA